MQTDLAAPRAARDQLVTYNVDGSIPRQENGRHTRTSAAGVVALPLAGRHTRVVESRGIVAPLRVRGEGCDDCEVRGWDGACAIGWERW